MWKPIWAFYIHLSIFFFYKYFRISGKQACEILGISYEEIIEERKKDAKANMEYFYQQLMAIPAIKEMMESEKYNNE